MIDILGELQSSLDPSKSHTNLLHCILIYRNDVLHCPFNLSFDHFVSISITFSNLCFFRSYSSNGNRIGFASQLRLLVNSLDMSYKAQFMEDFVSGLCCIRALSWQDVCV